MNKMCQMDEQTHRVTVGERQIGLTPKEWNLLHMIVKANGRMVSREIVADETWGHKADMGLDSRTVDQHVARIRAKLKLRNRGAIIETVSGFGYRANMDNVQIVNPTPEKGGLKNMSPEKFARFMLGIGPIYWTMVKKHLTELTASPMLINKLEEKLMQPYVKQVS